MSFYGLIAHNTQKCTHTHKHRHVSANISTNKKAPMPIDILKQK
jgi:hypothetical protein